MKQEEEAQEENVFTGDWFSDSAIMLEILNQITFYCGSDRKRMLYTKPNSGSMLYGTTWRGHLKYLPCGKQVLREKCPDSGMFKTKIYSQHPELKGILKEYSNLYFPDFEWNQVQLNKDFPCPPHLDSDNVGESVLVAFGNYLDGETCIWRDNKIDKYDAREKPLRFNGSKLLHWVQPIRSVGTRYSVVFFNNPYGLKKNNK